MTQSTSEHTLSKIHREAEASEDATRFVRTCRPGDEIRQGDIYLYPLAAEPEHDPTPRSDLQLAPNDGPGSRHIVRGDAETFRRAAVAGPLEGPLLHARRRVVLGHPEHADISLPAGWYEVRYQRDFTASPHIVRHTAD